MVKLELAGRSFEIAPYKLGTLRKVAHHIDALNAAMVETDNSMEALFESIAHVVAVLAPGIAAVDPVLTEEALMDLVGADDMTELSAALRDLLAESGLTPKGEAAAPTTPAAGA